MLLPYLALVLGAATTNVLGFEVYPRSTSLQSCLQNAGLSVVTASSSSYSSDIAAYNQRIQPKPTALIHPSSADQISSALKCAASNNIAVSARSGGHSYASYGLGGVDGALVIDLSSFKGVSVDSSGKAKIASGMRLGDIALALNEKGWALSHGTCPFVGIGGHAGFGGFGLAARQWGLTLDAITAYDVVLANGTIRNGVTRSNQPDLFFALNGASPSFGIVTNFYVQTQHAPSNAVIFSYSYYDNLDASKAAQAFDKLQSFGNTSLPATIGLQATIGKSSLVISGVAYMPENDFNAVIEPLKDELPSGYTSSVESFTWIKSLQQLAGNQQLNTTNQKNTRDDFYTKSLMTPSTNPITIDVLEKFFNYLFTSTTNTNWFVQSDVYGGKNSMINTIHTTQESSFMPRGKLLSFQMYASSPTYGQPYYDSGFDFVDGMYDVIVNGMTSTGSWSSSPSDKNGYAGYVNYVDPRLSRSESATLYYGSLYPRLQRLKQRFDPKNVLRYPQSIGLPSSS